MFKIVPPRRSSARGQAVELRLARSVAGLFGVDCAEPDYDWTWVSELSRLTLVEVAQGCPNRERGQNEQLRTPGSSQTPGSSVSRAISPTSLAGYGPDTLAAAVLSGCNYLYGDVAAGIHRAFEILGVVRTGAGDDGGPAARHLPELPSPTLRLQLTAALLIEAYLAAPALFLAGAEARSLQRRYFHHNRHVQVPHTEDWDPPAKCELNPHNPLLDAENRDGYEFAVIDATVRSLKLTAANGIMLQEAPERSGLAGTVASHLSEVIQGIGSPAGRGALRIVENPDNHKRRAMQAFVPTIDLAHAFAETVLPRLRVDDVATGCADGQTNTEVVSRFDPALLKSEPWLIAQATVLAFWWLLRIVHSHQPDQLGQEALVKAADQLSAYVASDPRFAGDPLAACVEVTAAELALTRLRETFKPDNGTRDIEPAVQRLIHAIKTQDLRGNGSEARLMDLLFTSYEALNGVRRDLQESTGREQKDLLTNISDHLEKQWDIFFSLAEGWDPAVKPLRAADNSAVVPRASLRGELAHRFHNFASYLGFDIEQPDHLEQASNLFRRTVLPARAYTPGEPRSAQMASPRPDMLQRSLEAAAHADAALALKYREAGFQQNAAKHAAYAREYARAISGMPEFITRRAALLPATEVGHERVATARVVPGYHDATTAVNLATAYRAAALTLGEAALTEADKSSCEDATAVAALWVMQADGSDTALARRLSRLTTNPTSEGTHSG